MDEISKQRSGKVIKPHNYISKRSLPPLGLNYMNPPDMKSKTCAVSLKARDFPSEGKGRTLSGYVDISDINSMQSLLAELIIAEYS